MQALPEWLVKAAGGHSKNMDTFGVYGHEVQGDMSLTAQLVQNRFDELLSNSQKNNVKTMSVIISPKNKIPENPHNKAIFRGFLLAGLAGFEPETA